MIHTEHGFSLFELLIVLVIIGILANISYPIYTHALIKTRRTEAKIALMDLANRMENYYLENNNSYLGASLGKLHIKVITDKKFYQLFRLYQTIHKEILRDQKNFTCALQDTTKVESFNNHSNND